MPNSQFHTAISAPRFNRYLAACDGNRRRAEKLYRVNLRLSQKMYAVIGLFEVILRNSIDRHFLRIKGPFWLEESAIPGGYLDTSAGCEVAFHAVQEAIQKLGGVKQKDVFKNLIRINDARNRIAHYEPICFDKPTGTISPIPVQRRYDLIIEMLHWLGCSPKKILYGIDSVQNSIRDLGSGQHFR